jgi:Protein of unknown function (DUF2993).
VTQEKAGLGEQALNKIAEVALSTQLDKVERLEVQVKTDPSRLAQGELESLTIDGDGLVMQENLRMEKMEMQISTIAVDPWKALMGNIKLTHPAEGTARIVLTEADINCAFNSEPFIDKLRNLDIAVEGKPVTLDTQRVDFHLLADGKVSLDAEVLLRQTDELRAVSLTTTPRISPGGQGVSLEDTHYSQGKELSPELNKALIEKATEILNLHNFEMEGISLIINQLDVEAGKLTLQAEAKVTQFPSV